MDSEEEVIITDKELDALKNDVLKENIEEISHQLGDPGRYFASFKAKDILDQSDCEHIKSQITSVEKATAFIDTIGGRTGRKGEHPYDVFVGALKRMKVHIHIVRILNQALAKKRSELKTHKRANLPLITTTTTSTTTIPHHPPPPNTTVHTAHDTVLPNGFPNNGVILNRGALPVNSSSTSSSSPTTSSSTSSSTTTSTSSISTNASTPPSLVTSPRNETDRSLGRGHTSYLSPTYNRITSVPEQCTADESTTTTTSTTEDFSTTESDGGHIFPSLPIGYNSDGSRQVSDVEQLVDQVPDETIRPDVGPLPPTPPPMTSSPLNSCNLPVSQERSDESFIIQLQERIQLLETDNKRLSSLLDTQHFEYVNQCKILEEELKVVLQEKEKIQHERDIIAHERDKLSAINRHLESQMTLMRQGGGRGKCVTTPITTPTQQRLLSPNFTPMGGVPKLDTRRVTDPYINKDLRFSQLHHRPSEPTNLSSGGGTSKFNPHTRPNNLPLGIMGNGMTPQITPSYQDTPYPLDYRRPPQTRQSPGSDSSQDGLAQHYYKVSHSTDDLTSGGEDQNSVRSFGSNHSGGKPPTFELSGVNNTHSTVV